MPANDFGQVVPGGQQLRAFELPLTATQEESAVAHDLACLWREVQVGEESVYMGVQVCMCFVCHYTCAVACLWRDVQVWGERV